MILVADRTECVNRIIWESRIRIKGRLIKNFVFSKKKSLITEQSSRDILTFSDASMSSLLKNTFPFYTESLDSKMIRLNTNLML